MSHVMRFDHAPLPASAPSGPWAPHAFLGVGRFLSDPVTASLRLSKLGNVVPVSGRSPAVLLASTPEIVRTVLTDEATWTRPPGGLVTAPPGDSRIGALMHSMILMHGPEQKTRRRILVPPMHRADALANYGRVMAATAAQECMAWGDGDVLDMADAFVRVALHNQLRCLLGVDDPTDAARIAGLVARVGDSLLDPMTAATQWLARKLTSGRPIAGTRYAARMRDADLLYGELLALVKARRAAGTGRDVLSALIASTDPETGASLTDDELVGEVMALYSAGYETTARAMLWTVLLLAMHPEVADAVTAESRDLLHGRAATAEQIRAGELPLLDRAILESMRLLPPAAISIPRVSSCATRLGGLDLPEDATVLICPAVEHRDAETFPEPMRFMPECWEKISPSKIPYRYMPFGAGPRRCVGAMIAETQIRVVLSLLVQRWSFQLVEPRVDHRTTQIVMGPAGPVHMRLARAGRPWPQSRLGASSTLHNLATLPIA